MNELMARIFRHLLTSVSGGITIWLVEKGASAEQAEAITAGVIACVMFISALLMSHKSDKKIVQVNKISDPIPVKERYNQ